MFSSLWCEYCLLNFNKFFSSGRNLRLFGYSDKYMCYLFSSCLWGQCSAEAANALFVPTKVECLTGVVIKMVALGSEHSIAVTGSNLIDFLDIFLIVVSCSSHSPFFTSSELCSNLLISIAR